MEISAEKAAKGEGWALPFINCAQDTVGLKPPLPLRLLGYGKPLPFFSAEKTKLMTNNANGIQREIKVKGQKLGTVTSFKYLGAVVSDDGSKPKVLSRIAQATAALTKLKPIWRDNNISLGSKVKLMCSFVISIFLYTCESWTLTAELEKRTQAFEMRYYRRLLNISYKDHVTNEEVRRKIQAAIGEYDELLTLVKKRKLRWFGHVSRSSSLAKTILPGSERKKKNRQTD